MTKTLKKGPKRPRNFKKCKKSAKIFNNKKVPDNTKRRQKVKNN